MANPWDNDPIVSTGGGMRPLPSPADPEAGRKAEDQNFQRRADARASGADARSRAKDERERLAWEATHNPDGSLKPSAGMSKTQTAVAREKLNMLQRLKGQIARVEEAEKGLRDDGWGGPLWGNVPGSGAMDDESARYDKAVASLTALIRQLTRTPGEGAMSDYESKLAAAIPPARSDNRAAREEAMAGIRDLVGTAESGYAELLGTSKDAVPEEIIAIMKKHGID